MIRGVCVEFRKARMDDVEAMHHLINVYAEKGLMPPRSRSALYEGIREFMLACDGGKVVGCGSLHILWHDLAEIRSLAIASDYAQKGTGRQLVNMLLAEAAELGLPRVFALTYVPDFFQRCGFHLISKDELPQKVWKECINCPKFPDCDETALVIDVNMGATKSAS